MMTGRLIRKCWQGALICLTVCFAASIAIPASAWEAPRKIGAHKIEKGMKAAKEEKAEKAKDAQASDDPKKTAQDSALQMQKGGIKMRVEDDSLIQRIRSVGFTDTPAGPVEKIGYKEVLKRAVNDNAAVLAAKEKVNEAEINKKGEGINPIAFVFKTLTLQPQITNVKDLAAQDVESAKQHIKSAENQSRLVATQEYYRLIQALMARYLAYQGIQQGINDLQFSKSKFVSGESANFEVLRAKTKLVSLYQDYLDTDVQYLNASRQLSVQLGMDPEKALYPKDFAFENGRFQVVPLLKWPTDLKKVDQAVNLAMANRPELEALRIQSDAMDHVLKGNPFNLSGNQRKLLKSKKAQLEIQQRQLDQRIEALVRKAWDELNQTRKKRALDARQLQYVETALRQMQVSQKAGFSSLRDVEEAQATVTGAQVSQVNQRIILFLKQAQVLYEIGKLDNSVLLGEDVNLEGPAKL
ncbi:MAG: TolC family protein [Vampirovibrio sp.]|nr:TolC family protein [Vampirovibrio sp.]